MKVENIPEEIERLRREQQQLNEKLEEQQRGAEVYQAKANEYQCLAYEELKKAEPYKRAIDELRKRNNDIERRIARLNRDLLSGQ